MLAWLQAALPDCKVTNLSSDWSSGLLLSALVDYCEPGIFLYILLKFQYCYNVNWFLFKVYFHIGVHWIHPKRLKTVKML
jgi:hypothetical protein